MRRERLLGFGVRQQFVDGENPHKSTVLVDSIHDQ
jgi:hypothetical protein